MTGGKKLTPSEYYEIFFKIRNTFNSNKDGEYDNFLHKTDQSLRNISMYLIENYIADYSHCSNKEDCVERCKYLNEWLKEKKAIYTSNGKCTFYNKLWEEYIDELWDKLDESIQNSNKCKRDANLSGKNFPGNKFSEYCNKTPLEVLSLTSPDKSYANTCTTILTMSYVALGIVIIYLYLFKFSNLGNRIENIIKNKLRIGGHMDEHENDELLRNSENETMSPINRMYNINYNSPRN
ncbi:PIR Superfamily Protein [Plasmodium ovale wallikeri]|uniref:PIR Superfamily Protein n=2 Tax=Plasmodium ovale TaxID=36330 RepID=A0A1A9AR71_PLAOA|nr:PIR Superfamily Protein [Plasmodium ovale curtisi]SBT52122.1 PIR Superfamily Protein [Plasmodium ovale wallikeri]SBT58624.1 PIR Superfamily Protein [Plasmodium ovale wallikeri]